MPQLNINGRTHDVQSLLKVIPTQEARLRGRLAKNGSDDVLVRVDNDMFVASGRPLPVKEWNAGDPVEVVGRTGYVVALNDEAQTAQEGLRLAIPTGLLAAAVGLLGGGCLLCAAFSIGFGLSAFLPCLGIGLGVGLLVGCLLLLKGAVDGRTGGLREEQKATERLIREDAEVISENTGARR